MRGVGVTEQGVKTAVASMVKSVMIIIVKQLTWEQFL